MRKTPLKRSKPLPRGKPLKRGADLVRRKRMAKVNPERKAKRWTESYHSEAYLAHVHSFDCIVPGCESHEIEACHAKSRGAGGTWRDLFPACRAHHEGQHRLGVATFQREYGVSVADAADRVHERWLLIGGSPTPE